MCQFANEPEQGKVCLWLNLRQVARGGALLEVEMSGAELPVLVVEDEEMLLGFLQTALKRGGIPAAGACSGEQALDLLATRSFSGIVSDLLMPGGIGGAEIYDWVCRHQPHLKSSFLFITGNTMDEYAVAIRERTGAPFIQKPFRIALLLELIRKIAGLGTNHA